MRKHCFQLALKSEGTRRPFFHKKLINITQRQHAHIAWQLVFLVGIYHFVDSCRPHYYPHRSKMYLHFEAASVLVDWTRSSKEWQSLLVSRSSFFLSFFPWVLWDCTISRIRTDFENFIHILFIWARRLLTTAALQPPTSQRLLVTCIVRPLGSSCETTVSYLVSSWFVSIRRESSPWRFTSSHLNCRKVA